MIRRSVANGLWSLALILLLAGALAGCNGSSGSTGARGPEGPPGPGTPTATALDVTVSDVTIESPPVVDFTVTDQDGLGFPGVPVDALEVTIAKLVPGTNGDTDHWQNYINEEREAVASDAPVASALQPETDSGGSLVDHGDGTYTYTFGTDITNVTQPAAIPYEPALTHRVAIAIRSSTLPGASNGIYTWQPSTGTTTGIPKRLVAETASCNDCHTQLEAHGGPRRDVRMCVTCHNPGNSDPNTGHSLDFRVLIHKIHDASNLPSFTDSGTPYEIYGFRDRVVSFTDPPVVFPQDVRNCTKCHSPSNPATPDASNTQLHPSMEACGACHDDVDFAQGKAGGHPGGVETDNSECTLCHRENSVADSVAQVHEIPGKVWAARFKYNILQVKDLEDGTVGKVAPGHTPVVTFSVTDPTNGDAPYDITSDAPFTAGGASSLSVDIAWSTSDYTNTGSGAEPSEALRINALSSPTDNGDGTFTVTAGSPIPSTVNGSAAVALEGHPAGDFDGDGSYTDRVPVTSQVSYVALTDSQATPRRSVVDVAKCQVCHGTNDGLSLHGNNRTDRVQLCVMCHNPRDTDVAMRPADPDTTHNGVNTAADDDREQQSIDFKRLVHAIHGVAKRASSGAGDFIIYGFGARAHNFADIRFPGEVQKCTICHTDSTYQVPLDSDVLATTIDTGVTNGSSGYIPDDGSVSDPTDDVLITPTASVCSACHGGTSDTLIKQHMVQNGASFDLAYSATGSAIETCAVCHGSGRIADLDVVHGLKQD